jgi:diguanylate cyclase (GGDEF)-like protein
MISRFLKIGANDYIPKPFTNEELIARVSNTLTISEMFKKINNMAMTDYLTGLHNRAYFYQAGDHLLAVSKRGNYPLSLCMIDIDNFKSLNDKYGHDVGDQALIHVANIMQKTLRKSDIIVRFGGEEFIILLSNCSHDQAYETMQKITDLVYDSTFITNNGEKLKISISSGLTSQIDTLDKMVAKADSYMYKSKENGKNQVYSEGR